MKWHATLSVKKDIWLGVWVGDSHKWHDSSLAATITQNPLRLPVSNDTAGKYYSDGTNFTDGIDYDFENPQWKGPCVYLKYSIGFQLRDSPCSATAWKAFMCEWKRKSLIR